MSCVDRYRKVERLDDGNYYVIEVSVYDNGPPSRRIVSGPFKMMSQAEAERLVA